jgi:hypothetical protein
MEAISRTNGEPAVIQQARHCQTRNERLRSSHARATPASTEPDGRAEEACRSKRGLGARYPKEVCRGELPCSQHAPARGVPPPHCPARCSEGTCARYPPDIWHSLLTRKTLPRRDATVVVEGAGRIEGAKRLALAGRSELQIVGWGRPGLGPWLRGVALPDAVGNDMGAVGIINQADAAPLADGDRRLNEVRLAHMDLRWGSATACCRTTAPCRAAAACADQHGHQA